MAIWATKFFTEIQSVLFIRGAESFVFADPGFLERHRHLFSLPACFHYRHSVVMLAAEMGYRVAVLRHSLTGWSAKTDLNDRVIEVGCHGVAVMPLPRHN